MNIILFISCLLVSNNNNNNNNNNKNNKHTITSGNDERPNYVNNKLTIKKIYINFEKKQLLNYLQSDKISVFDKINIISVNKTPKPINVLNGGLLNDWNFDI
jgi:hypothetical protein